MTELRVIAHRRRAEAPIRWCAVRVDRAQDHRKTCFATGDPKSVHESIKRFLQEGLKNSLGRVATDLRRFLERSLCVGLCRAVARVARIVAAREIVTV